MVKEVILGDIVRFKVASALLFGLTLGETLDFNHGNCNDFADAYQ